MKIPITDERRKEDTKCTEIDCYAQTASLSIVMTWGMNWAQARALAKRRHGIVDEMASVFASHFRM
jgi:hypothetical protein